MLPLIFLLDDMIPTGFLLFVGLLLFKLERGDMPPSRRGTGPVLENLLLTGDVDDIGVIVLDLFPVGRLGFPALLPGRLGRPRLPVMPGIDMVRFIYCNKKSGSRCWYTARRFGWNKRLTAFPHDGLCVL